MMPRDWCIVIALFFLSSGATALQGLGRQSGRRRSAKLVPTFADRGVSRGQRNGSPRPLIFVYRTWIATNFIQVAPQLTSRRSRVYSKNSPASVTGNASEPWLKLHIGRARDVAFTYARVFFRVRQQ